ncbi:MAG: hypothetical protein IT431_01490 [Phycisphaerales bacterium]|nr:hypothetical protein [Phycisphaerales bacterium]
MNTPNQLRALAAIALLLTLPAAAKSQTQTELEAQDPVAQALDFLSDPTIRDGAAGPGLEALDRAIMDLDLRNPRALAPAALAARLESQLSTLPADARAPLLETFAAHPELAAEIAFLLGPHDDIPAAYAVLQRLLDAHAERVAELAPLAAAICAVHDRPADRRVNENTVKLIDPVELFGYYAANERSLLFSPRDTPATALVHLADAAGSLDEYEWARKRYARDRNIGNRYHEITYDTRALKQEGVEKRVTAAGDYTLQNIRQLGGVCADQAYFALSVGKACGVPACYVVGKGGEVSHAWVGFLERDGRAAHWNFSAGRFGQYEDIQGSLTDPQTGEKIPDATLGISALSTAIPRDRRLQSIALVDAANRVSYRAFLRGAEPDQDLAARQFAMLEAALRLDPGNTTAWAFARDIAATPASTLEQKEFWTRAVDQLAAQTHPDFAFLFLDPIFQAEPDPAIRLNLWDWAADRFKKRPDLAARARLAQVNIMIEQGRKPDAITAARAVFDEFGTDTAEGFHALAIAEQLYTDAGQPRAALDMYEQAFRKLRPPGRMQAGFARQTTWYQVGSRYADLLDLHADANKAATIRKRLEN